MINYNDEYLYYVLGEPNQFVYPTGQRIYEPWTPRVLRGTTAVPAQYDDQILGGVFAVWCDLANPQTQAQVAAGIRMPLRALSQKLWDPGKPALSWAEFRELAGKVGLRPRGAGTSSRRCPMLRPCSPAAGGSRKAGKPGEAGRRGSRGKPEGGWRREAPPLRSPSRPPRRTTATSPRLVETPPDSAARNTESGGRVGWVSRMFRVF